MVVLSLVGLPSADGYRYTHEVLPGEHLRQIAKRYHTTARRIRRLNRLRSSFIRAGQRLKIVTSVPSRSRRTAKYTVRRGDTLSRIAKRHKMKVWLLRRLNKRRLRGVQHLRPGQWLKVVVEGPAPEGRVKGLYQLENGPGFKVRNRKRSWGTFLTVNRLHDVLTSFQGRYPGARDVRVLDISRQGGGFFRPHKSHRTGRDVDIAYLLKKKHPDGTRATPERLDPKHTWALVKAFVKTGDVTYIFMDWKLQRALYNHAVSRGEPKKWLNKIFQYPRRRRCNCGLIRHDPGHDTHFHVRFRREKKAKPVS